MFHRRFIPGRLTPLLVLAIVLLQGCGGATNAAFPPTTATPSDSVMSTPTETSPAMVVDPATPTATIVSDAPIPIPDEIANHNTTGEPVTLRSVSEPPLITQQQAIAIVAADFPWGHGGTWEGKPVTVRAWYGLGTIGYSGAHGWLGSVNIPLPSGQILDHIENRQLWLLAYSNVPGIIASTCAGCADPPVYTHDVYAVDAQSRSIIWVASYPVPSDTATGEVIPLPASKFGQLTVIRSGSAPTLSSADALEIVRGSIAGPLTDQISSTFGLATFGHRDAHGQWVGDMNVRLANGEIIDHIENRPMWIIDVAGIEGAVGGEPTEPYNHVVFAVDIESRSVVFVWSYPGT